MLSSRRYEALGHAALVEDLDRARMQSAGARVVEVLVRPALDHDRIDARQLQFRRQHQPRWPAPGDHYLVVSHSVMVSTFHRLQQAPDLAVPFSWRADGRVG